ncbi:L-threonyl-[L-threonyl-carrier protein] 4-chlorinase [Bombina bombina]|uniref:L-threonyl-[L-threonyl-carrier protein] 4-chlorinase n=1 Tax=Bombina bombina TaxID=8345 RepID=UPI00235AA0F7|nr:L-threonyl-[L-threonyl-carrier protein] 4-chlorinase [Bombina bombina]XP_053555082.1 L-threonyl-[L-threonyl-carrier protein] 4-chlorinase [Bombina bombina]XP_053555084.1 L-threonyl-[L-threonyl-carrier protein] 4-chlorinase [Bombina bombina]XP_053555085.1 L-threonyl-[L-threonyl-carrier protein] 4-chlorinase [Bombina bombina]
MIADANQLKTLYDANGYLTAIPVLNKNELDLARKEYEKLEEKFSKEYCQFNLHNLHMQYEWVMNLAVHPNVLKAITAILGPDVILLDCRFICKYSSSDVPLQDNKAQHVAWHQDMKYWGIKGGAVVSAWIAFDDVDKENGVLQVIPGSNKKSVLEHGPGAVTTDMMRAQQQIPSHLVQVEEAVECPLKAGEMSVHDGLTIHASEPNISNRRRCGLVFRYIPTCAYPIENTEYPRSFPAAVLVAGKDEFQKFKNNAPSFFTKTF